MRFELAEGLGDSASKVAGSMVGCAVTSETIGYKDSINKIRRALNREFKAHYVWN